MMLVSVMMMVEVMMVMMMVMVLVTVMMLMVVCEGSSTHGHLVGIMGIMGRLRAHMPRTQTGRHHGAFLRTCPEHRQGRSA